LKKPGKLGKRTSDPGWAALINYFEERVSQNEFQDYVEGWLETIGNHPIILGEGDAVMSDNLIKRVQQTVDMV
jgi:hypothetical protein